MKWFWRAYKVNGSFDLAIQEIGGCPFKTLDRDFQEYQFVYLCFNGESVGKWSCSSELSDDSIYSDLTTKGYEFKGNVGIKEIRKQKIQKIKQRIKL